MNIILIKDFWKNSFGAIPIFSQNSAYTVSSSNPGKFVIGEGVRTVVKSGKYQMRV